jgi:hypothetical protein
VTVMDRPDTRMRGQVRATTLSEVVTMTTTPSGRPATSLADLYRKAKKTGVLAAFSEYPQ